jgi:intracellular multiplication protein IcmE
MADKDDEDVFDDFETEDFDNDSGFDDYTAHGTLGDLWRNNPMVKIGVVLAAFIFIIAGVILFGGKKEKTVKSRVMRGDSTVAEAPGTAEVSESYRKAVEQENVRRVEEALKRSESAVPTPVEPPKGTLPLQFDEPAEEDPLERWRRMQEQRIKQQQVVAKTPDTPQFTPEPPVQQPPVDTRTPAVNALAGVMSSQMGAILENQQLPPIKTTNITPVSYIEDVIMRREANANANNAGGTAGNQYNSDQGSYGDAAYVDDGVMIPAASIEYAQLITEANSDVPGPVMAQLASGDYSGARLLGMFETTGDYLTLRFSNMVVDGVSYPIEAVAIDPENTLTGMATDVDHRYLKRVILPTAAAFIEGLTEAIADSGNTSIYIDGNTVTESSSGKDKDEEVASGIAEAGGVISELMEEEASKTKTLVKIRAGTPMGILFTKEVRAESTSAGGN